MITLAILFTAVAAFAAQESLPANGGPGAKGTGEAANGPAARAWQSLNRVALIVNEECVTSLDIQREVYFAARANEIPEDDLEQIQRLRGRVVSRIAGSMLEQQGGHDLGFAPEQVERIADDQLEREKERAGSISLLAEELALKEKDSLTLRTETRSYVYGRLFREAATGRGPSPSGRPSVDSYVRPGKLLFEYRNQALLRAEDKQVQFTRLLVVEEDLEAARALAEKLRLQILDGDDMGDLAERHGRPRGSRGASELLQVNRLREPFRGFLSGAEVGDLSEVLPYDDDKGQVVGYILLRVDEVKLPELPDFSDREYQRAFERRVADALEQRLILEGLESLAEAAYVWPPGALGVNPTQPTQAAQPEPAQPEPLPEPQTHPSQAPPLEPGQAPAKP
jgi:hypothetical protein